VRAVLHVLVLELAGELGGEIVQFDDHSADGGDEVIVPEHGGDGDEQAGDGGDQSGGHAGGKFP